VEDMNKYGIVRGPRRPEKQERAKQLRKSMTCAETILWCRLRANQFEGCRFRRQQVIEGFIADFYCHTAGLVIEVDGGVHETQRQYDMERDLMITRRGLRILRVTNEQVLTDINCVLDVIRKELTQSLAEPM
jgi:very-short-patch-repair endonuclease